MSEPVKSAEVEDVLSSIRRLVSEDKRPLQAPKPASKNDRLVLTPSLRVEEDVAAPEVDEEVRLDVMEEEASIDEILSDAVMLEAKDLAEDYDDDPYRFDNEADLDDDVVAAKLGAHEVRETSECPSVTVDSKAAKLSAKIAALETAIGDISDEWEPDAAGQDAYAGSKPEAMQWEDDVLADNVTDSGVSGTGDTSAEPASDTDLTEDVAEKDVKETANAFEADEVSAVETETDSENANFDQDDIDGVAGFTLNAEDQLLDEETLREMISEIVQSELQGALGERITRNVRRLVRREIHRALTARDLD